MSAARRLLRSMQSAWLLLDPAAIALRAGRCPMCGPGVLIRLSHSELGVRCLRCGGSAVHLSLAAVVRSECATLAGLAVYELSARGAWVDFLRRQVRDLTLSEYVDDLQAHPLPAGVCAENVERLSFADNRFDLVTCTDVFEHVEHDKAGFSEVLRVLRPGGIWVFTVPLGADDATTVERARRGADGEIEHLLPAEYHGDHLRGQARVLSFRDYAGDLPDMLRAAGFADARIVRLADRRWWGWARPVIVARKASHTHRKGI